MHPVTVSSHYIELSTVKAKGTPPLYGKVADSALAFALLLVAPLQQQAPPLPQCSLAGCLA